MASIRSFFQPINDAKTGEKENHAPKTPTGLKRKRTEAGDPHDAPSCTTPCKAPRTPRTPSAKQLYDQTRRVRGFVPSWLKEFTWLDYDAVGNTMSCRVCKAYPTVADLTSAIVKGTSVYRKDTLVNDAGSKKHALCQARAENDAAPEKKPILQCYRNYASKVDENTQQRLEKLANTAFFVTKENMSLKKFSKLCELQTKNGVDLGTTYQNDKGCRDFVRSIAAVEQETDMTRIENARFLCILAYGSMDSAMMEQEAVFVRFVDKSGEAKTVLCDIVALEQAHADGVKAGIDTGLRKVGVNDEVLKEKLVCCNFDGAAVMLGKKSRVAAKYKNLYPCVVTIHCVAHNLELAVLDVMKKLPFVKDIEDTVKGLFKWYYYSPKRRRDVNRIAEMLDENPVYFSGVHHVRWLASRYRAFGAVEKHLRTTMMHLEAASTGTGEDSARAKGFLRKVKNPAFIEGLYFLLDVMEVLSSVSVDFQSDQLFVTEVLRKLERSMLHLLNMRDNPGENYRKFKENFDPKQFTLKCGDSTVQLNQVHSSISSKITEALHHAVDYMDLRFNALQEAPFSSLEVFDPSMWPSDKRLLVSYGDEKIRELITHCVIKNV